MTGFTEEQLAALKAPLSREHVRTREQAGRSLSYLEGWHVIAEANRIFGFDGWDRETSMSCVSERETLLGRPPRNDRDLPQREGWRVTYIGKVRITVRAGDTVIVREGSGQGAGIDADLGAAHESAAKECETDCQKRALMTFGNPFGLALYDKAQAHVESPTLPAQAPVPARPPNGAAAASPPPAVSAGSEKRQLKLSEVRDDIIAHLEDQTTPLGVRTLRQLRQADIATISHAHPPTGEMLESLFDLKEKHLSST